MKDASAKTNSPCRIALLGCGAVSELYHAPALRHLEDRGAAKLVAVFDRDAERIAAFQKLFPDVVSHSDESFLEKTPLDLVIVASPVSFHSAQVIRALGAGIAVLCEKPMAANTREADEMIQAALKHERILAVGLLRRFYSNVHFTRQFIRNGTLGRVKSFSIHEGGPFNWPARSDSFFRRSTAGGGVLLDIGVHVLDLVIHWFGEPEKMTYTDDAMGGLEANCRIELLYASGFKGSVQLSRDWETPNRYVIEFERGTLKLRTGVADRVEIQFKDSGVSMEGLMENGARLDAPSGVVAASSYQQAFLAQLKDLIFAVQTGGRPAVPGEEGIRSLRLIEQCYQSRTSLMEMPWLAPDEQKSARILATKETEAV